MRLGLGSNILCRSLPLSRIARLAPLFSLLLFMLLCGCSSLTKARQEQDIVEAELRGQERHIQELKAELDRKEGTIHSLDLEVEKLQQAQAGRKPAGEPVPPGVIKEITLGRLTGGYRNNPKSVYDDSLQFLIEPKDADGHALKVPGSMHIELFEITPAGLKVPLSAWDITQREVRRSWDQPLFGGPSYRILIPFKALPTSEKMRVIVRFTTLDGALFEAEKDFTIRLPLPGTGPMMPMKGTPGGYSVITPGHVINGTVVGPLNNSAPVMMLPAPAGLEGTGRTTSESNQLPAPPVFKEPEKKQEKKDEPAASPDKKPETVPLIPIEPRQAPATIPTNVDPKSGEPPPLPPPPEIPQFDNKKKAANYESLPAPSDVARTSNPIYPKDPSIMQASYVEPVTTLTSPPPADWRDKMTGNLVQVQNSADAPIKLSRPVIIK